MAGKGTNASQKVLCSLGAFFALLSAANAWAESVDKTVDTPTVTIWKITEPNVKQNQTTYGQILLSSGDKVNVTAGGCVQTGGHGKTWKRYVDPAGPNSDHLYHGLILLPGMAGATRIGDFIASTKTYDITAPGSLALGYEDDQYDDNGYYDHDDGTGDQCKNVENAWFQIVIVHKTS
jgi:hypothetical protein